MKMRQKQKHLIVLLLAATSFIFLCWTMISSAKFIISDFALWRQSSTNTPALKTMTEISSEPTVRSLMMKFKGGIPRRKCPNILWGMAKGRWISRPLTEKERTTIGEYLREARGAYKIPRNLQRVDGRCGDVTYKGVPLHKHMWFRAICDPMGHTPCCHTNRCRLLPEEDCRCPTCYDERQAIHAEYAQWKPDDDRCQVGDYSSTQVCRILDGMTLYFMGDSFIRHIFAALVIILTNQIDGALKTNIPKDLRDQCTGMHQITGEACRDLLDHDRLLCDGKVNVTYVQIFSTTEFSLTHPLLRSLRHVNKSIMILGLGIHNNFNVRLLTKKFILPFLNLHQFFSTNLSLDMDTETLLRNLDAQFWSDVAFDDRGQTVNITPRRLIPHEYPGRKDNIFGTSDVDASTHSNGLSEKEKLSSHRNLYAYNQIHLQEGFSQPKPPKHQTTSNHNTDPFISNVYQKPENPLNDYKISLLQTSPRPGINRNRLRPRLLWVGAHAPGLLKSSKFVEQSTDGIQSFNTGIRKILDHWQAPFLDTFSFSNGTISYDGTHYGWGINMLKANMLLTYIQEEFVDRSD